MKRLVAFLLLFFHLAAFADMEIVNGVAWGYTIRNGVATVGGGSPSATAVDPSTTGSISVPSSLGGYPVTCIAGAAFFGCSGLTSILIPGTVTNIGEAAFVMCSGLTSIAVDETNPVLFRLDAIALFLVLTFD